jgi:glycosyltransferase involved in cell wall biosynthesis
MTVPYDRSSEAQGKVAQPPIRCVIFSKDRPLQLDAALSSLEACVTDLDRARVTVLYAASAPFFAAQYRIVGLDHPNVELLRERDFKRDLLGLVAESQFVFFVVDDAIFVAQTSLAAAVSILDNDQSCIGFSYRLGRNTRYCYTMDKPQNLPPFEVARPGLLRFQWPEMDCDFGYPIELSSSMYRTGDLLPLLESQAYKNPNTLESVLASRAVDFRESLPRLACYEQSVAVSIPANLVQTAWTNRVDGHPELSADSLAHEFAKGRRLDIDHYRGHVPGAAHEELPFVFKQRSDAPAVSVVIPCYKQAEFLPEAVESVVLQTFTDWEVLIVDDGSPDGTMAVAEELARRNPTKRIRYLRRPNGGLARARNSGIEHARGAYILPLDADDKIAPTMLERTCGLLEEQPGVAIAYTDLRRFGNRTEVMPAGIFDPAVLPAANQLHYCSLYRREVWEAVGGYNPNMVYGYEDWDFWVGAVERGYVARRIPEPLFEYRVRYGTMFAEATAHDAELRRQMRRNHPSLYRWDRRIRSRAILTARSLRWRIGRVLSARRTKEA